MKPNLAALRDEAYRAATAIDERDFTVNALERQVKNDARHIYDLIDYALLLERVAHAAWHLMDDSGEWDCVDGNGYFDYLHSGLHHEHLSTALDALEASGWDAHPDPDPAASTVKVEQ